MERNFNNSTLTAPRNRASFIASRSTSGLGNSPGRLALDLDRSARQPLPRLSPQVGIPADLIRNRPDLRIDERMYYASVAETGAARADLYPRLSLGGAITVSGIDASGTDYAFGPTLQLPALPNSPRRAAVEAREAQARLALARWKSDVLDALLEVETALASYAGAAGTVHAARKSVALHQENIALTRELVTSEGATLRDLADAEVASTDAELALADGLRRQALAFIALNTAIGSGATYGDAAPSESEEPPTEG
jgi:multidrug efflux system outer membrane protein